MKRMLKYKHTDAFYKKQYIKYNDQVKTNVFNNFDTFKSAYIAAEKEGKKDITKNFVYETNYEISYDTYKAERDAMKELGIKIKKADLLGMTTQEFADKYNKEIHDLYWEFRRTGETSTDIKDFISSYFFGSI